MWWKTKVEVSGKHWQQADFVFEHAGNLPSKTLKMQGFALIEYTSFFKFPWIDQYGNASRTSFSYKEWTPTVIGIRPSMTCIQIPDFDRRLINETNYDEALNEAVETLVKGIPTINDKVTKNIDRLKAEAQEKEELLYEFETAANTVLKIQKKLTKAKEFIDEKVEAEF